MASSRKKESEAFSLLQSMYQDDDEDEDIDDISDDDNEQQNRENPTSSTPLPPQQQHQQDEEKEIKDELMPQYINYNNNNDDGIRNDHEGDTNNNDNDDDLSVDYDAVLFRANSAPAVTNPATNATASIVDYAHDDAAMSPVHEDGEISGRSSGRVTFGEDLRSANDIPERMPTVNAQMALPKNQPSPQVDVPQADNNITMTESEAEVREEVEINDADPLEQFFPPPPELKCSDALQEKINKFLAYKRQGRSYNVEVRNRKDYRNPDFLRHAVTYQEIDEIGSNFSKDVFDPHGYDKSDFYDEIEADMKREMERKEQERKKTPKVDFVSTGTQAAVAAAQRISMPSPGVPNLPSGGSQSGSTDTSVREGRHNKRSKWDKVDVDRPRLSGGQDTVSTLGTQAALLSAANAGAGYSIFAQQKRREAEERRTSDKKVDRRS